MPGLTGQVIFPRTPISVGILDSTLNPQLTVGSPGVVMVDLNDA